MHRLACVLFLTLGFMSFASANDHLRDYYQEPGLNPFKEDAGPQVSNPSIPSRAHCNSNMPIFRSPVMAVWT